MRSVFRLLRRLTVGRATGGLRRRLEVQLRRTGSSTSVQRQRVGPAIGSGDGVWDREERMIDREVDRYLDRVTHPDRPNAPSSDGSSTGPRPHRPAKKHHAP
jgi:hypothetical protein